MPENTVTRHSGPRLRENRLRPESSQNNCILDAGIHQHDGKDT